MARTLQGPPGYPADAEGWNGRSLREHVEQARGEADRAVTELADFREELGDDLAAVKARLGAAEAAAAQAMALAQAACAELAEQRGARASTAAAAVEPATPAEGWRCGALVNLVENAAGSACLAIEAGQALHGDVAELKRQVAGMACSDLSSGVRDELDQAKRRIEEIEAEALIGVEAAARASGALEALAERLAALDDQTHRKPDV